MNSNQVYVILLILYNFTWSAVKDLHWTKRQSKSSNIIIKYIVDKALILAFILVSSKFYSLHATSVFGILIYF